jgi:hypothetical protein
MIVYFHRNPITYQIFYVGIGVRKWRAYDFKTGRNPFWRNYVNKYGDPIIQIVHSDISKEKAHYWERFYIKLWGRKDEGGCLTNISTGGDATPVLPEQSRQRSTAALVNWVKNNPDKNPMKRPEVVNKFKGENNSSKRPEVREKLRKANIGKRASEETRLKQSLLKKGQPSNQPKGYKHSEESLNLITERNKENGKLRWYKINMLDKETKEIIRTFDSVPLANAYFGKHGSSNINTVIKGNKPSAFGYKWEAA